MGIGVWELQLQLEEKINKTTYSFRTDTIKSEERKWDFTQYSLYINKHLIHSLYYSLTDNLMAKTNMWHMGGRRTISVCGKQWCWMQLECQPWCRCRPLVDGGFAASLKDTERVGEKKEKEEAKTKIRNCRLHLKHTVYVSHFWRK